MALTPKYLQECTDDIEKIYWELGTDILVDIAERIKAVNGMTATAEYLNEKLREMGLQQAWINQMLAKVMNTTEQEVEKLMNESTHKSTRSTFDILQKAGYDTTGLEFSDQILKTTNALNGDLQNLTRTTGQLATKAMMNAYDQAYLQVSSGAYSLDQAVTNAIQKLAKDGLGQVEYPSGAHRTVEAAVRVAVRTAVSQNALACEKQVIDERDVNLVETSSHIGARPSHEVWQGKVFWVKYPEGNYENFYEATGYGTPTGLGGYNCRHQFYPYFPEFGQTYKPIPHEVNDAAYKAEQRQRAYERKIREWDRKERILKAGGQDTTEARRWKNYYKGQIQKLVDQSKGFLKRDYSAERSYVPKEKESSLEFTAPTRTFKGASVVGRVSPKKYKEENLKTNRVILTEERKQHIRERHPEAFETIMSNIKLVVEDPSEIYNEVQKKQTRWAIRKVDGHTLRVIIKLETESNSNSNSIITAQFINEKRIKKYLEKGQVSLVYKRREKW